MKYILLILLGGCMISCGDQAKKAETVVTDTMETVQAVVDAPMKLSNGTPVYNYDQLSEIINKEDGKTYVINFWATWCKPCVEELPYFEKLNDSYKGEVEVILVSLDFKKQFEKKLVPFMADRQLKSDVMVLLDPDSNTWINSVNKEWSGAIPATIIRNGTKKEFREGSYASFDELNDIVKTYL